MFRKIAVSLVLVMLLVPAGSSVASPAVLNTCGPPYEGNDSCDVNTPEICDNYVAGEIQALEFTSPPVSQSAEFCRVNLYYVEKKPVVSFRFDVLEPWNHPDKQVMCNRLFPIILTGSIASDT